MRKVILGVALVGIVGSIALAVRSQLTEDQAQQSAIVDSSAASAQPLALADSEPVSVVPLGPPAPQPELSDGEPMPAPDSNVKPVAPIPTTIDDEAQETGASVLKRASAAYSAVKSLRADFVQKRANPILGSNTSSRGTLSQRRPDRFLLKFTEPAGDVIVSDGRYFWLYYPSVDKKQVMRAPATTNAAGGVDLQAQFLGDPLTRFKHTYHGTETVGGRTAHVLTLVPRQNIGYKSLKVWIDAKDSMARRFSLTENNGVVQEFTLSNLVINPALSDAVFKFTPPTDARIVERP